MKRIVVAMAAAVLAATGFVGVTPAHTGPGGAVYTGFSPGDTLNGIVYASTPITLAGTQKYIVGGSFLDAGPTGNDYITIFNANGTIYTSFSPANRLNGPVSSIKPITVSGEQKFLIGGLFTDLGAADNDYVAILNADGTVYTGFSPAARINGVVSTVAAYTTGGVNKYLVGGSFTNAGGYGNNNIALLHANGVVDTSFAPGSRINNIVRSISHITIGGTTKYLLGGSFTNAAGSNDALTILNSTGTVYSPFAPGDAVAGVVTSARPLTIGGQPKYLVTGDFNDVGAANNNRVAIFNADGSVYTGFSPGNRLNSTAYGAIPTTVGGQLKYVIVGSFTDAGPEMNDYLTMLNANGSHYTGFSVGSALSFVALNVSAVTVSAHPRFLVSGWFSNVGTSANDFVTIFNAPVMTPSAAVGNMRVPAGARATTYNVRWDAPLGTSVTRPVSYYRVTIQKAGSARLIANVRVSTAGRAYAISRARLTAGLQRGRHSFIAKVTPMNGAGAGPTRQTRFVAAK